MNPIELFGHGPRFIRLQRADEMPFDLSAQIGERLDLRERLLDVVFAEGALTGREGRPDVFGRERLGDGKQLDRLGGAVGRLGRAFDAGVNGPQVFFDMGHRLCVSESTRSVADYTVGVRQARAARASAARGLTRTPNARPVRPSARREWMSRFADERCTRRCPIRPSAARAPPGCVPSDRAAYRTSPVA